VSTPRHASLEAAIAAAPDDVERWLVYADWLQQQGHPRGELIRLDVESARTADSAQQATLREHAAALAAALPFDRALGPSARRTCGFVTHATLGYASTDFVAERPGDAFLAGDARLERLGPLLAHDDGRYLAELALQTAGPGDWAEALALVRARAPASLRRLSLYARQAAELPGGEVLPDSVRALRLEAGQLGAEAVQAPRLTVLDVEAAGFEPSVMDALAASALPALTTLRVSARYTPLAPSLRPLLSAQWPALTHLALHGLVLWPEDLRALARSGLLARLSSLDLSSSAFLAGLSRVAEAAGALERLDVSGCQLLPAQVDALRVQLPRVAVDSQGAWPLSLALSSAGRGD
jgi:uncharacterized protein (TIGR02996 family)